MPATDLAVLIVIGVCTVLAALALRRRGARGPELRTAVWLCFYGTTLIAMMTAHSAEILYRLVSARAAAPGAGLYDFRAYSLHLLSALLIGAGVICLRAVPGVTRARAEARRSARRASLFALAVVAPLIPIQPVFGVLLSVLSLLSILLLAGRRRAPDRLDRPLRSDAGDARGSGRMDLASSHHRS